MSQGPTLPGRRDAAVSEAARLRYELSRLRAKRSVRLALLAADGASPRKLLATLRGTRIEPDLDVIPPVAVDRRPAYPHLRVAHPSHEPPFGWVAEHTRVASPADLAAADADLLVLGTQDRSDDPPDDEPALVATAQDLGMAVVRLLGEPMPDASSTLAADLVVEVMATGSGQARTSGLVVAPWVDAAHDNPVGWEREAPPLVVPAQDDALATSRAVLGALARGRTVVTPDVGVLPDLVQPHVSVGSTPEAAGPLVADVDARERASVRARRLVLSEFEALPRFEQVLAALGIPRRPPAAISVLLATKRPDLLVHALEQVARQDHRELEIIALLHGDGFDDTSEERARNVTGRPITVERLDSSRRFGDVLNRGLELATGDLVAKMDDDDHYGPRHLSDLVLALRYSGADVVGRWANEVHVAADDVTVTHDLDRQERWAHHLPGGTLLAHADAVRAVRFRRVDRAIDTHLLRSLHAAGGSAYATHRFGYIRTRRTSDHTFEEHREATGATGLRPGLDRTVLDA